MTVSGDLRFWAGLLAVMMLPLSAGADIRPAGAEGAPAAQVLVPCAAHEDRGCVEVLLEADTAAGFDGFAPCWTLPPYGDAGVSLRHRLSPVAPDGAAPLSRRLSIEVAPLSAVPPGTVSLRFGRVDRGTGRLACALTLDVTRVAGTLAAPATVTLPDLRIEAFGLLPAAPRVTVRVGPAAGSVAVGPLRAAPQVVLTGPGRSEGAARVVLDGGGRIQPGQTTTLAISPVGPLPLGALAGEITVSAPQLAQPQRIAVATTARIGPVTILLALILGVAAGWLVRSRLLPAQDRATAVVAAEQLAADVEARAEAETDPALREAVTTAIAALRAALAAGGDAAAVTSAATALEAEAGRLLSAAAARRAELAAVIAPALAAYRLPIEGTELPQAPLALHRDTLRAIAAMLSRRLVADPEAAIADALPAQDAGVRSALRAFGATAAARIAALDGWTDAEAGAALAPVKALAPAFAALEAAPDAASALTAARGGWDDLAAAGAGVAIAIGPYLLRLQRGAADRSPPFDTAVQTAAVLRDLGTRPLAALAALADLQAAYAAVAGGLPFAQAFAPAHRGGVEAGPEGAVAEALRPAIPGPALRLVLPDGAAVAGRPVTVEVAGLAQGEVVTLRTPVNALRVSPEGPGTPVRLIFDAAGAHEIVLDVAGADPARLRQEVLHLTIAPAPGAVRLRAALEDRARRDRQARWAAGLLALGSGAAVFAQVPLTAWSALAGPLLWGFFVDLNLRDWIGRLQARRDALLPATGEARPG